MKYPDQEEARGSLIQTIAFVASAALAAAVLRFAWDEPILVGVVVVSAFIFVVLRYRAQRRLRTLFQSGDVRSVLERWSQVFDRIPHAETMAPIIKATAFTAYGWVDKARASLAVAERGPAWDAALEHRLFLDTLLCAFEGDSDNALSQAQRLERLPPPSVGVLLRNRVATLRASAAALARAFAHQSLPGDRDLLLRAGELSPLVFWAMHYAAAVVAIDQGETNRVAELIANAPNWPEESSFRAFHDEIAERAGLGEHPSHDA